MSGFACEMKRRMHDLGVTQAEIAAGVPLSQAHVSRLVNGLREPTPQLAARIDDVLGAGGELAKLAVRPEPPAQPTSGLLRPLDAEAAARIRADVGHLVALDTAHGSTGLLDVAVRSFRSATDRLARAGTSTLDRSDVYSATADLGALVAWVAADAVEHDLSRRAALEALAFADVAGDLRLHEFAVSHLSMVAEHAGRAGEALAFADRGLAEHPRSRRVQAMFRVRRARALGLLGATDEALGEWEQARRLLADASERPDDGVTYWLHKGEQAIHRAVVLTHGGRAKEAVEWSRQGVDLLPAGQGRDQVLFRAMHLEVLVRAHAWRDAEHAATDLAAQVGDAGSARVPRILRAVQGLVEGRGSRAPRGLRDAVREAVREALGADGT